MTSVEASDIHEAIEVHWVGDANPMDRWRPSSIRATGGGEEAVVAGRAPPAAGPAQTFTTQKTKNEAGLFVFFTRAGPSIPTWTMIQNPVERVDSTARRPANRKKWSTKNQNQSVLCIIMSSEKHLNSISEYETFRIIFITKNSYLLMNCCVKCNLTHQSHVVGFY